MSEDAPEQISSVHDAAVDLWLAEVHALKPAKRGRWKGIMINQSGARSSVRYCAQGISVGGAMTFFQQRLPADRKGSRGTELDWIPVFSLSARASLINAQMESRRVALITPMGARPILTDDQRVEDLVFVGQAAPITGDADVVCAQVREHVDVNATGNHRSRHHAIRVPTAGGEPVRG